jgi:hypothetical protein
VAAVGEQGPRGRADPEQCQRGEQVIARDRC